MVNVIPSSTKKGLATIAMAFLAQNAIAQQVSCVSETITVNGNTRSSKSCAVGAGKEPIREGQTRTIDGIEYTMKDGEVTHTRSPYRTFKKPEDQCRSTSSASTITTICPTTVPGCIKITRQTAGSITEETVCPK